MSTGPEQPSGANEFAPLESTPSQPDPYAPVDYPTTNPGLPPPVYGTPYPQSGYPPQAPGYPAPTAPQYAGGYQYAPNPYAPDPYYNTRPAGTNGKALGALICSVAGLLFCGLPSIVGLILGIIAMRETKRNGQEGYGLALAGAIIGGLITAAWVIYLLLIFGLAVSGWSFV